MDEAHPDRAHLFGIYILAGPEASDLVYSGATSYYAESGRDEDARSCVSAGR